MLKVFSDFNDVRGDLVRCSLPFDLEKDRWEFTDTFSEADIVLYRYYPLPHLPTQVLPHQIILGLALFHVDTEFGTRVWNFNVKTRFLGISDRCFVVHTNLKTLDPLNPGYDMMFNRQKAYFTDYDLVATVPNRVWTREATPEIYALNDLTKKVTDKKFLSPMRVYHNDPRMIRRRRLYEILEGKNGFLSNTEHTIMFESNGMETASKDHHMYDTSDGVWYPIADTYYERSYVSIYVETVVTGTKISAVTEKTFDPLIKGNFILPFGHYNMVQFLKDHYGFRFPDWIDYSYDEIVDDDLRFAAYERSINQLLSFSLAELHALWQKDFDIIEHNRNVFLTRPYDTLYDKVVAAIKANRWDKDINTL